MARKTRVRARLFVCALLLSVAPMPLAAQERPLSELAFPLEVAPGDEVSFALNVTLYDWYLYAAAQDVGSTINWWGFRDGSLQFGGMQSDLFVLRFMEPGQWNLTFETAGRVAIIHELSGICGWQVTSTNLDQVVCPALQVAEATGFAVTAWSLDRPYLLRVDGEVEVHFFDAYLRPLGVATERRYDRRMDGIVVVVPRGASATAQFSVVRAPSDTSWTLATAVTLILSGVVAVAVLVALRRRLETSQREVSEPGERKRGAMRSVIRRLGR